MLKLANIILGGWLLTGDFVPVVLFLSSMLVFTVAMAVLFVSSRNKAAN